MAKVQYAEPQLESNFKENSDRVLPQNEYYIIENLIPENSHIEFSYIDPNIETKRTIHPFLYYLSAGIIVFVLGIAGYIQYIHQYKTNLNDKIFSKYYSPEIIIVQQSNIMPLQNTISLAYDAFNHKKYVNAIELFNKAATENPLALNAWLYKGIAGIEIGQYKQAIEAFNMVIQTGAEPWHDYARWYIALTWIKLNNSAAAIPHLNWLNKNNLNYSTQANEILATLQNR